MGKDFNLYRLHKGYDTHPRSWICFAGKKLKEIVGNLEKDIKEDKEISREKLSEIISEKLNCSKSTIKTRLQGNNEFYPIPLILELSKLYGGEKKYLKRIHKEVKVLKINSGSSKKVKAVKRLTEGLAKIVGAFMADGNLSYQVTLSSERFKELSGVKKKLSNLNIQYKEGFLSSKKEHFISLYLNHNNFKVIERILSSFSSLHIRNHVTIEIADGYKSNLKAFGKWVKNLFDIKPSRFEERGNYWRSMFINKILGRYLICFFGIKPGPKAKTAFEPKRIKNSPLSIRKEFGKGVLMFDGSVSLSGKIMLESKSKELIKSIKDIFNCSNLEFNSYKSGSSYNIYTYKNNEYPRLLEFFEKGTFKWLRLKSIYESNKDLKFKKKYYTNSTSKIGFKRLAKILKKVKICDRIFLSNHFNCNPSLISSYVNILANSGKVKLTHKPLKIKPRYVGENTRVFLEKYLHNCIFKEIKRKFGEYQNFADSIGIHKSTLSAWKNRKSRMPLKVLKEICKPLSINFSEACEKIKECDRELIIVKNLSNCLS